MPEEETRAVMGMAVSVQDDGDTIGLHIEYPGVQFACKFPVAYAEQAKAEFPALMDAAIAKSKEMKSGLVTPQTGGKLEIVKGN